MSNSWRTLLRCLLINETTKLWFFGVNLSNTEEYGLPSTNCHPMRRIFYLSKKWIRTWRSWTLYLQSTIVFYTDILHQLKISFWAKNRLNVTLLNPLFAIHDSASHGPVASTTNTDSALICQMLKYQWPDIYKYII